MELTQTDAVVFVYTLGVMLSGLWLADPGSSPEINPVVITVFGLVSVGWTAYFKWQIAPQFVPDDDEDDDEPEMPLQHE